MQVALGRNTPHWRLRHTCLACSYKLKGEAALIYQTLVTMDGNDSLKRILRCERPQDLGDEAGAGDDQPRVGESSELKDSRKVGGDYYLSQEQVDKWAKTALEEMLPVDGDSVSHAPLSFQLRYLPGQLLGTRR
jgi:hypothetical protein